MDELEMLVTRSRAVLERGHYCDEQDISVLSAMLDKVTTMSEWENWHKTACDWENK